MAVVGVTCHERGDPAVPSLLFYDEASVGAGDRALAEPPAALLILFVRHDDGPEDRLAVRVDDRAGHRRSP